MTQNQYQAQQLATLLEAIQNKQASGVLYIDAEISPVQKPRSRVLVWQGGRLMYGGSKIPDAQGLVKLLEQKLSREWAASAVAFAMRQIADQSSIRALLERLVEMQLFNWEQIESVIRSQLLLTLEQVIPHPGKFQFDSQTQFNFWRGLELSKLMVDIAQRQEQWYSLKSLVSSMDAVPRINDGALQTITDPSVGNHLQYWVDGRRSLR